MSAQRARIPAADVIFSFAVVGSLARFPSIGTAPKEMRFLPTGCRSPLDWGRGWQEHESSLANLHLGVSVSR